MISIIFGIVIAGVGALTLSGRPIGLGNGSMREKYTEASIAAFIRKAGICEIITGAGSIVEGIFEKGPMLAAGFALELGGIFGLVISYFTTLKKRIQ